MTFIPQNFGTPISGASGLTATGTNQATAFPVFAQQAAFSTVASGTGAVLPPASGGPITIYNDGANALLVYPAPGDQIQGSAIDAAVTILAGRSATFTSFDGLLTAPPRIWHNASGNSSGGGVWNAGNVSAINANNLVITSGTLGIKSGPTITTARGITTAMQITANTVASPALIAASILNIAGPDGAVPLVGFDAFGTGIDPVFRMTAARGTAAAPTAVQANDFLGEWDIRGYAAAVTNNGYSTGGGLNYQAIENFTTAAQGTKLNISVIGQGSTAAVAGLTISGTNTGKRVQVTGGISIDQAGTFVANGTTAVTIAATGVTAASAIAISKRATGGTPGALPQIGTVTAGTNFTTSATAGDTSTYNYAIIN